MSYVAANNARSKLAASLGATTSDSVVTITGGDALKFPSINNAGAVPAEYSYLTMQDAAGNFEHMKAFRHDTASSAITVVRGSAAGIVGTTDDSLRAWAIGDSVAITLNAQLVKDAFVASISAAAAAVTAAAAAATAAAAIFPAGTRAPFAQAYAPVGWTQDTSDAASNRMLRVVNTVGGGTGGSASPILNNVVPSHTHTFTSGTESAYHVHTASDSGHAHAWGSNAYNSAGAGEGAPAFGGGTSDTTTSYANITLGTESATHTHSGTTQTPAGASDWAPRYIDMIICSKDA